WKWNQLDRQRELPGQCSAFDERVADRHIAVPGQTAAGFQPGRPWSCGSRPKIITPNHQPTFSFHENIYKDSGGNQLGGGVAKRTGAKYGSKPAGGRHATTAAARAGCGFVYGGLIGA